MSSVLERPATDSDGHYALRRLGAFDMPRVAAIEREVYAFPWTVGNFRDCLASGYDMWGIDDGGELIAYAIVMFALDEAHLLNLAVASGHQRRGIGRYLMEKMMALARGRGATMIYLEVRPSNSNARTLYDQLGFRQIAIRPNYYPSRAGREDALLLAAKL